MNNINYEYKRSLRTQFSSPARPLDVIGSKWRVQILASICVGGNNRFREIERSIPGLTTRMLSRELKIMESLGLIVRNVYPSTPVLVEYKETELCNSLIPIFDSMLEWGEKYGANSKQQKKEDE